MNRKNKMQLLGLGVLLVLVLAAFGILKFYQSNQFEEDDEAEETYTVLQIDQSLVREIEIINDTQTIHFLKDGEEWKLTDEEETSVDSDAVDSYLEQAAAITSSVRIASVEDLSQYGLEQPKLNITLQWDSNMYTICVGDYNTMIGSYYISLNEENTVYTIDSSLFYTLNKTLEDFMPIDSEVETTDLE